MAIALSTLLYGAFRVAGITDRPGRTPSTEQYADAIAILNRMIGSWNVDRLKIYSLNISAYNLTAGKKSYQIGPGATDFNTMRPVTIESANIIVNTTTPVVRFPCELLSDAQWAAIQVQDIPGTIPWALYSDGGNPIATLYLYGQPLTTYQLELYTWQAIPTFAAITDSVVLPPGYEEAIVYNLAVRIAVSFPTQAQISPEAGQIARDALMAIESINAPTPIMKCDGAVLGVGRRRRTGNIYGYLGNNF